MQAGAGNPIRVARRHIASIRPATSAPGGPQTSRDHSVCTWPSPVSRCQPILSRTQRMQSDASRSSRTQCMQIADLQLTVPVPRTGGSPVVTGSADDSAALPVGELVDIALRDVVQ